MTVSAQGQVRVPGLPLLRGAGVARLVAEGSSVEVDIGGKRGNAVLTVALAAPALGYLAFLGDEIPGLPGAVILALTSSGFAWGLAAYIMGYLGRSRAGAVLASSALLLIATAVYYALIVAVSQRWRGGVLADGSSAAGFGLLSVARAMGFWVIGSLCAGPLLGLLGDLMRRGSRRQVAVVAGTTFGLLAAEGWHALIFVGAWRSLDEFGLRILLAAAIMIISTGVVTAVLCWRRRLRGTAVWTAVAVAIIASAVGALLWLLLTSMRIALKI